MSWALLDSCPVQPSWLASSRVLEKVDEIVHSEWGNAWLSPLYKVRKSHQTRKTLISFMELPSMAPSFPGKITVRDTWPVSQICDIRKISRETRWHCGDISVHVDLYLLICTSKEVENSQTFRSLESPCTTSGTFLLYLFSCIWLSSVCWHSFFSLESLGSECMSCLPRHCVLAKVELAIQESVGIISLFASDWRLLLRITDRVALVTSH